MSTPNTADNKNSKPPVVTVVIPCHNHADMIGEAIDSVVMQDYRPVNIVVVDDGSDDSPEKEVAKRIEKSDINIILIKKDSPTGPSAARNSGISYMWEKSDLFMMLDADDLYLPGKISKSVAKYLESEKYIGIVYSDAIIENIKTNNKIHEFREPFSRHALERECIISNTPLISKQAINKTGGYDVEMRTCEDWDLWLRITENFVAAHIPEPLHVYRVTGKNASDIVPKEVWEENWKRIGKKIEQRRNAKV